jgi:hypothetical protein
MMMQQQVIVQQQPVMMYPQQQVVQTPYQHVQPPAYGPYIPMSTWQPIRLQPVEEKLPTTKSAVVTELTDEGIKSNDERLNQKGEMSNYFETYSSRPQVLVTVWGHHTETRHSGSGKNRRSHTVTITDFRYSFELTPYILPGTIDGSKDKIIEGYLSSGNSLKRCIMTKNVQWNFGALRGMVEKRIRDLGWTRSLTVSLNVMKPSVKVESSSDVSKCLRHPCTDVLCVITCMCVLYYPLKWCYQADFGFQCQYPVSCTPEDFYQSIVPQLRLHS